MCTSFAGVILVVRRSDVTYTHLGEMPKRHGWRGSALRDPLDSVHALRYRGTLAGVLEVSQTSTGEPSAAMGIELTVIAAVVIGGTSIYGGEGAIWRTVLGVLLLTLIGNGFDLLNVNVTYQQIIQGAIILAAVGIDSWSRRFA